MDREPPVRLPEMDRRLLAALCLSLLVHVAAVSSPGWRLPFPGETEPGGLLEARIAPKAAAHPRPAPVPVTGPPAAAPPPRKSRPAPAPAPAPVLVPAPTGSAPTATVASEPPAAPEPAPAAEPAPPAPARSETAWPRQGRIRFIVTRGEGEQAMELGQSTHSWRHDGATYALRTVTETTGLAALFRPVRIVQSSEGEVGAEGLSPKEFRVERNGQPAESALLDRNGMKATLMKGGRVRREAQLIDGTQDLISQIYHIGLLGIAARIELMIATGKNYGRYAYEAAGDEKIATPFGELNTWHVKTPALPGEQTMELWLASDYRNLPVRIRYRDRKGDVFDQTAVEIEIDGTKLAESAE